MSEMMWAVLLEDSMDFVYFTIFVAIWLHLTHIGYKIGIKNDLEILREQAIDIGYAHIEEGKFRWK